MLQGKSVVTSVWPHSCAFADTDVIFHWPSPNAPEILDYATFFVQEVNPSSVNFVGIVGVVDISVFKTSSGAWAVFTKRCILRTVLTSVTANPIVDDSNLWSRRIDDERF